MIGKIVVTGATGNIGSEIVKALVNMSDYVIAAVHNVDKAKGMDWKEKYVQIQQFDYSDPRNWKNVFRNVDCLVLIAPAAEMKAHELLIPVIDFVKKNKVQKIIFISALGVEKNDKIPLRIVERHLETSGINYTILRCNWFMQNFAKTHLVSILHEDIIRAPVGNGKVSFIDCRDIAEFAREAILSDKFNNQIYQLTGREALSYSDVAKVFTNELERPIEYQMLTNEQAQDLFQKAGMPKPKIEMYLNLYNSVQQGWASVISNDFEQNLHRKPNSLSNYVADYYTLWDRIEPLIQ